jgi:hypothetical protein
LGCINWAEAASDEHSKHSQSHRVFFSIIDNF